MQTREVKGPETLRDTDQRSSRDVVAAGSRGPETCTYTDSGLQGVFLDPAVLLQTGGLSWFAEKEMNKSRHFTDRLQIVHDGMTAEDLPPF